MRKMLFGIVSPVDCSRRSVTASTHGGALCGVELRGEFWRRSSHALSGVGCSSFTSLEGRKASLKASCSQTREIAIKNSKNNRRRNIWRQKLLWCGQKLQAFNADE